MILNKPLTRSARSVLTDETGSGTAEGLGAMIIIIIVAGAVSAGVLTNLTAVEGIAIKAERQAVVSALVADKREGDLWGAPDAPTTATTTLDNGHEIDVTAWREVTPVGITLTAVAPITAGVEAADCTGPSDLAKTGCIYASRFHAGGLDDIEPIAIVRKDPSTAATPIGVVEPRVSTADSIPQGTNIASGSDAEATVWRYLVTANSLEPTGEIRITQAGKILALVPVDSDSSSYFGTFSAAVNVPVTATVSQGNVVVKTIYIYRAGGTS